MTALVCPIGQTGLCQNEPVARVNCNLVRLIASNDDGASDGLRYAAMPCIEDEGFHSVLPSAPDSSFQYLKTVFFTRIQLPWISVRSPWNTASTSASRRHTRFIVARVGKELLGELVRQGLLQDASGNRCRTTGILYSIGMRYCDDFVISKGQVD